MSEIKLRADEARDMASHIKTEATAATDQMNSLRDYLTNLANSFTGQAATAFENTFADWKEGSDQMLQGLEDLGEFLNQAATAIEDTDTQIASQLNG